MKKQERGTDYQQRLQVFLRQIEQVERRKRKDDLYEIMDTPVFRDLETALMMVTNIKEARV